MTDPLVARTDDPESSTQGIRKYNRSDRSWVFIAGAELGTFTDSELHKQVEHLTHRRHERGHIARTRLYWERQGMFKELPEDQWRNGHHTSKLSFDGRMTVRGSGFR